MLTLAKLCGMMLIITGGNSVQELSLLAELRQDHLLEVAGLLQWVSRAGGLHHLWCLVQLDALTNLLDQ